MYAFQGHHLEKKLQHVILSDLKISARLLGSFLSRVSSQETLRNVSIVKCDLLHISANRKEDIISAKASVDSLYIKQLVIPLSGFICLPSSLKTVRLLHLRRLYNISGEISMDLKPHHKRKQVKSVDCVVRKNMFEYCGQPSSVGYVCNNNRCLYMYKCLKE